MFEKDMEKYIYQSESILNKSKKIWQEIQGIYFLIEKNDIVYVGQSSEIIHRISNHAKDGNYNFDEFSYIKCPKEFLDNLEAYYIYTFKPKFNSVLPKNKYFKSINQMKEVFNLPVKVLRLWIKLYDIKDNGDGYYCLKDFNGLSNFKEWMIQKYRNLSLHNCSVKFVREYSQNSKSKNTYSSDL
ncbi:MAG: hypothetical protein ISS80_04270 [Candidatus Cloacimonetes bacterium]|nr:hypothetical protein [Bacteroidota bacterium]MBL7149269.1 hypothetical protein [Candidatus Cloacimonadota bacterium]